jgi:hypothetical protein
MECCSFPTGREKKVLFGRTRSQVVEKVNARISRGEYAGLYALVTHSLALPATTVPEA